MAAGFLIAFVLAAVVLAIFGAGDRGTEIALRATARWSFLLFWLAYAGSAIATPRTSERSPRRIPAESCLPRRVLLRVVWARDGAGEGVRR